MSYAIFSKCGTIHIASVEYRWNPPATWSYTPPRAIPVRVRVIMFRRPSSFVRWYRARRNSIVPGCGNFGALPNPPFTGSNCPFRPSTASFKRGSFTSTSWM